MKTYAIILASGVGKRFDKNLPKQFTEISGRTILERTVDVFENTEGIDKIILVIPAGYIDITNKIINRNKFKKISQIVYGGELRKDSSYNGVFSIKEKEANVIIHDCARPFVTSEIIKKCILALKNHDAIGVAIPSSDTIIEVENNIISNIPKRNNLMRIQTPQCFKLSLIKKAHELAKNDTDFTDDCGLIVKYGLCDVYILEGNVENIKVTYPSDFYIAEILCDKIYTN